MITSLPQMIIYSNSSPNMDGYITAAYAGAMFGYIAAGIHSSVINSINSDDLMNNTSNCSNYIMYPPN